MKKTKILSLVSLGAFLLTTSGCTDYDFDSKYEDPSKVTQVTISNLMVGVFQKVKDYDVYEYNRFFGFDSQFTGKYAQTFGYSNTTDMYTPGYIPAIDGQWDNVYSALAQFRKLEFSLRGRKRGRTSPGRGILSCRQSTVVRFLCRHSGRFRGYAFLGSLYAAAYQRCR
mgnify:CR=1 FL=1